MYMLTRKTFVLAYIDIYVYIYYRSISLIFVVGFYYPSNQVFFSSKECHLIEVNESKINSIFSLLKQNLVDAFARWDC